MVNEQDFSFIRTENTKFLVFYSYEKGIAVAYDGDSETFFEYSVMDGTRKLICNGGVFWNLEDGKLYLNDDDGIYIIKNSSKQYIFKRDNPKLRIWDYDLPIHDSDIAKIYYADELETLYIIDQKSRIKKIIGTNGTLSYCGCINTNLYIILKNLDYAN
jgi:hypothetical protein